MFWRFGGYANISSLDNILDKENVTVEELLDESDLIQELKQQNSKLVDFLRKDTVLKKLLDYVTAQPSSEDGTAETPKEKEDDKTESQEKGAGISFFGKGKTRARSKSASAKDADGETEQDKKEAQRKKYAYVSCEVLSSEVWSLTEAILEQPEYLREFWQYLYQPAPLDPLQAGYFTKVNEGLLDKKTEEMLAFFKSLAGIVPAMLQHVDCPMVMDLLLKIISLEKHEGGHGIVDWLQSQDLIPLLLGYLTPAHNSATQTSAGDFLKAIITISANATTQDQSVIGPNELTRQLVSEKCIKSLIEDMLRGGNALTVGVGIIIEVIRKNNSDYDLDNQVGPEPKTSDPIYLGTLLRQFANNVPNFMHLIRSPAAKKPDLKAAFGRNIEPLGFDRFKTCELMAELLHCSNMGLLNERGAEDEVIKRDVERQRLKAEGKLATPRAPNSPGNENSHDEFGSSVDSHGFHHAERPSDDEMNESATDVRKLEVQNAFDEDGFEKVNAPEPADEMPDEVTFDDLNEKIDQSTHVGLPLLEKVVKRDPTAPENQQPQSPDSPSAMPAPLSPKKPGPLNPSLHFDPPPTHAADSPTTAGVTDRINKLDVDEDTVMTEFGEDQSQSDDEGTSELERELVRSADKPAPLFVKKDQSREDSAQLESEQSQTIDESVATLQGEDVNQTNGARASYETESDGSPVVGDLLKIQFVEHQVVPTILDFFFRFPWNNFLHNVVYDVVQQVFNGTLDRGYNQTLAFDLFRSVHSKHDESIQDIGLLSGKDITDRILDGQKASEISQQEKNMRLGYMGHLTLIAEEVCKFGNRQPADALDPVVLERVNREDWTHYVDGTLAETREKDNTVLGGVRPENAVGMRAMGGLAGGGLGGFTANTANTLANAGLGTNMTPQDSLAMSEGTVGQSFEINHGFGDNDDDEEMEDESTLLKREQRAAFGEEEQASPDSGRSENVAPLNIPPSRARRTLAARLAQRNQDKALDNDPDGADHAALQTASMLPEDPPEIDLDSAVPGNDPVGLQITGLRTVSGANQASKFSGLFSSSDDDEDDSDSSNGSDIDEDDAGRDHTLSRTEGDFDGSGSSAEDLARQQRRRVRRPSTTEAKERQPLYDDDDDDDDDEDDLVDMQRRLSLGAGEIIEGPFADPVGLGDDDDDSSDGEMVEIKSRRTS